MRKPLGLTPNAHGIYLVLSEDWTPQHHLARDVGLADARELHEALRELERGELAESRPLPTGERMWRLCDEG